jgi:hypothetical protein
MKIELGIKPNCSEWDQEVEADFIDDQPRILATEHIKSKAYKEAKDLGWDS